MTFLQKYELLKKSIPVPAVLVDHIENCEFVDATFMSKNSYYSEGYYLEDCIYTALAAYGKKLVDCMSVFESEKCYQSADSSKCYSCTYLSDCSNNTDCHFSVLLNACTDCFGCVGLVHKKYCIFNKQYTKEEYFKKIEELKKQDPQKLLAQMFELKKQIPHPASQQSNNDNCPYGDNIYNSKNCYWSFNTLYIENSGYTFNCSRSRNCWDSYRSGGNPGTNSFSERCYQMTYATSCFNCAFLHVSENSTNCYYGEWLLNCTDCIGCIGLKNKKYCILNNQLTKDQFVLAQKEIKKELGWKF